ncbi:hypothetical protein P8C59_004585 [Phyllachora maydis]|uniref:Pyoverdine biosynthesis n=1 Tax=Phyllachora maydis TaxID=1825666 RepID=A0AAD9MEK1_9PEZI|nr:hypothetical protein P8C59_004585 [Phyllachora maydis]
MPSTDVPAEPAGDGHPHTTSVQTTPSNRTYSEHLATAEKILDIIDKYRFKGRPKINGESNPGQQCFLALIADAVRGNRPVPMCLPAFPCKSPNTQTKVLGRLPDKGEALALGHLNGLCAAIGTVHAPGATLIIISDGLVYNDLLGVPDSHVWAYGEALRALAAAHGATHVRFSRLRDLVRMPDDADADADELDEMRYVANATDFRRELLNRYGAPGYDAARAVAENADTCLTYRGYQRFLQTDLAPVYPMGEGRSRSQFEKGVGYVAKQMLKRGDAFARAVQDKFGDHVRLSIHPSSVGDTKISISVLPTDSAVFTTP